jgi:DNA replication protein DnaC
VRACPCCNEQQHAVPIRHYNGSTFYIWNVCQAMQRAWNSSDQQLAHSRHDLEKRQLEAEKVMGDSGLSQIARFTLASFDPDRLRVAFGDDNPRDVVTNWLSAIKDLPHGDYHSGPPIALHLYYAGKGTGKTHLAAGAALAARAMQKLTVFLEEVSYLERTWAADFGDKEQLSMLPGETAWLTVLDDIGQNPPGRDPKGLQKAWYNIINRRWLKAGWTIITSNKTLDELMDQRTLSDAAHSRLRQMTRNEVVLMEADDQRLRGVAS